MVYQFALFPTLFLFLGSSSDRAALPVLLTLPYRTYPLAALLLAVGYHVERVLRHRSTHQLPLSGLLLRLLLLL